MSEIAVMIEDIKEEPQTPGGDDGYQKLVDLLCPDDGNLTQRYYRWNFTPVLRPDKSSRTIEFRKPPGSLTVDETTFWCQFTVAFTHAAYSHLYRVDRPNQEASLEELRWMLRRGGFAHPFSEYDERNFDRAFKGSSKLPEGPYEETPFTKEDLAKIRAKARREELKIQRAEASVTSATPVTAQITSEDVNSALPFQGDFSDDEHQPVGGARHCHS